MSSKQQKLQMVGGRPPVKRPSGSAGLPKLVEKKLPKPRIAPLTVKTITKKDKNTPTVKTIDIKMMADCNTLDVKALTGETVTLKIVEDTGWREDVTYSINLDTILVKTLAGETITLTVKPSDLEGGTKDILIAQLNILLKELNKILNKEHSVPLTSLMVTLGKVKAIHNRLSYHYFLGPSVNRTSPS